MRFVISTWLSLGEDCQDVQFCSFSNRFQDTPTCVLASETYVIAGS